MVKGMNINFKPILHNKIVLYVVFFIALADLFLLASTKEFAYAFMLIVVGFLASFFSKNMIVILCIALAFTNIIKYGTKIRTSEGFEDDGEDDDDDEEDDDDDEEDDNFTIRKTEVEGFQDDDGKEKKDDKKDSISGDYKELMALQKEIFDSMSKLQEPLAKAENMIEKMRNKKDAFRNKK